MSSSNAKKKKDPGVFEVEGAFFYERDEKPGFLVRTMARAKPLPTVDELWASEALIDADLTRRRARYKCKKWLTAADVERWATYHGATRDANRARLDKAAASDRAALEARRMLAMRDALSETDDDDDDDASSSSESESSSSSESVSSETREKRERIRVRQAELRQRHEEHERRVRQWNAEDAVDKNDARVLFPHSAAHNGVIAIWQGDITTLEIDAVVNAAKESLLGGGGVDGAIHEAAGDWLFHECKQLGGAEVGQVKATRGYNLPARFVLNAVGPVGKVPDLLAKCYEGALDLCLKHGLKSVAFSSISTGVFGYPLHSATRVALDTTRRWLDAHPNHQLELVCFCVFPDAALAAYDLLTPLYFPTEPAAAPNKGSKKAK